MYQITIDNFFDNISDEYATVVDAIFWLGDNPPHDVYEQVKSEHLDTTLYITHKLKEKFPKLG